MSNQYTGTIGTYQNGFGGGGGGGSGTVTNVSVISANGLSGNVANPTTTPAITLSTTVTGIVKGNGTTLSAAIAADFPTLNQNTTSKCRKATGYVCASKLKMARFTIASRPLTNMIQHTVGWLSSVAKPKQSRMRVWFTFAPSVWIFSFWGDVLEKALLEGLRSFPPGVVGQNP